MNRDKIKTGVPWSRHLVVSPKLQPHYSSEEVARAHSRLKRIQAGLSEGQKKATSEINLWSGDNLAGEVEECWDSQSDPGSASLGKNRRRSSSISIPSKEDENTSEGTGESSTIYSKKQIPLYPNKGKNGTEAFELRRRNGANKDGNSGNEDFIIEIPEEVLPSQDMIAYLLRPSPNYVHTSYDFMYYSCVSSFKWDSMKNSELTRRQYGMSVIQKIIVVYVAMMATFASFAWIKYFTLNFLLDRTLNNFIDCGYFVTAGAFQLYVTYFLATHQEMISTTLRSWSEYESNPHYQNHKTINNKMKYLPGVIGLITVVVAALKPIILCNTWKEFILQNSKNTAEALFLWTPEQIGNTTYIQEQYGTDLNVKSYSLGILGFISTFCFNFQVDSFKDLIIWVAVVNKQHVLAFGRKIDEYRSCKTKTGENSEGLDDNCWNMYRDLKRITTNANSVYNKMLILNHVYSFLTFSYFLTFVVSEQASLAVVMMVGYNAFKGIFPYVPARTASQQNDKCRKWIQTLPCETKRFRVEDIPFTREIMLLELEKEPLGLGSGQVHINNEFLVSFLTFVASLFCFLLNLDKKDEEVTRY